MNTRFSTILTMEQARILFDLVKDNRISIVAQWKLGIYDGLLMSLACIDRSGGALLPSSESLLDYFRGDPVEATIVPASSYIALPGRKALPGGTYLNLAAKVPEFHVEQLGETWRSLAIYRAMDPLAVIPLMPTKLPQLPLK